MGEGMVARFKRSVYVHKRIIEGYLLDSGNAGSAVFVVGNGESGTVNRNQIYS